MVNTIWLISYSLCGDKDSLGSESIQLLPKGKINSLVNGTWVYSQGGHWWLTGKRLQMDDNDDIFIRNFDVTVRGNAATGKGGSPLAKIFCVRMTKR